MNQQEKIYSIANAEDLGWSFFLLFAEADSYALKLIDIEDGHGGELAGLFISRLRELASSIIDSPIPPISTADGRSGGFYRYDLAEVPERLKFGIDLLSKDESSILPGKIARITDAKALLVLLGRDKERICLYRHLFPFSMYRKKNLYECVASAGAAPSRLKPAANDFLRLDGDFDFLYLDGEMYTVGTERIQKSYGFSQAILAEAQKSIKAIAECRLVESLSKLEGRVESGDVRLAKKVVKAVGTSKVLSGMPPERVIEFTKKNKFYADKFKYSQDGKSIILSSIKSVELFLRLIGDDYLYSELSETYYEIIAKDLA